MATRLKSPLLGNLQDQIQELIDKVTVLKERVQTLESQALPAPPPA